MKKKVVVPVALLIAALAAGGLYFTHIHALERAAATQGTVTLVNAQVRWQPRPDITVTLYGRNLTDEVYRDDALSISADLYYYGPPREYGVEIRKTF